MVDIDSFVELSHSAIREEDTDRLIKVLLDRNVILDRLIKENELLKKEDLIKCIALESKILERLKSERKKLLRDMDAFSKSRAAAKTYSSTFPFPPMPAFFDKKG
jgi:hypothetical protein